jgi:chromosome segregation ATPase
MGSKTMMTATTERTGLAVLAEAIEAAREQLRQADTACGRHQPAHDEAIERVRAMKAERWAAPDAGATLNQLKALDRKLGDAERELELAEAEARRLVAAREAGHKAVRAAEQALGTARRRGERLPEAIGDVQLYVRRRRSELDDARRVVGAIEQHLRELESTAARLEQELVELTGGVSG